MKQDDICKGTVGLLNVFGKQVTECLLTASNEMMEKMCTEVYVPPVSKILRSDKIEGCLAPNLILKGECTFGVGNMGDEIAPCENGMKAIGMGDIKSTDIQTKKIASQIVARIGEEDNLSKIVIDTVRTTGREQYLKRRFMESLTQSIGSEPKFNEENIKKLKEEADEAASHFLERVVEKIPPMEYAR